MPAPTLTLSDIARVAGVQRPVVTTWRRRTSIGGTHASFPAAVARTGNVEHFDRDEVVAYLRLTGRGNRPVDDADLEAASYSETGTDPDTLHAALTLRLLAGEDLAESDAETLLELAEWHDPGDAFLRREISTLITGEVVDDAVLLHVDEAVAASYGAADALDRLAASWSRRSAQVRGLSAGLVTLVAGLCGELAEAPVTLRGDALAVAVAQRTADATVTTDATTDADDRRTLREVRARGLRPGPATEASRPLAVVSVLGLAPQDALTAAENAILGLGPGDRIVVLGAATVLCDDRLPAPARQLRDEILRSVSHHLRFAARLPHGHDGDAPRAALGLWVVQCGDPAPLVVLADVSTRRLDEIEAADLALDAYAAVTGDQRRQLRYARTVERPRMMAGRSVVPPGIGPRRLGRPDAAAGAARVDAMTLRVTAPLPEYAGHVAAATAPGPGATTRSIAELRSAGEVRLRQGFRLDPTLALPPGAVRVIDPVHGWRPETFDPLDVEDRLPRAVRTKPGDVVFVTSPRPRAVVDVDGGSLVVSPARILRPAAGTALGPHLLCELIERQPDTATDWRAWHVPVLRPEVARDLESHLAGLQRLRRELAERAALTTDLAKALIEGAATDTLTLVTTEGD